MRPRYYCDHCGKGSGSPSAMTRHERGCTKNPERVCGMCAAAETTHGYNVAELIGILDKEGFKGLRSAVYDCPACILSALRTKNYPGDECGPGGVTGPNDGRETWNFSEAKMAFWDAVNRGRGAYA